MSHESIKEEFLKAYDQYSDAIFRYCCLQVSDRQKAKDLTQDVFLKTWEYVADGKKVEHMKAFLYRIAANAVIDDRRKKKPLSLDKMSEAGFDLPDGKDEGKRKETIFEGEQAMKAVSQLPEKYRDVLMLRYVDDLSVKEIAEVVYETENNVSVRIHRGLEKLKNIIQKNG